MPHFTDGRVHRFLAGYCSTFNPCFPVSSTRCGHILCGACLHGATTARAAAAQPLCPVCRTPIPGLRFAKPEPLPGRGVIPGSQGSNSGRTGSRRPRKRHVPPASRTLPNGVSFPTPAEDMIDQDRAEIVSEGGTIDVDNEEVDEEIEDAARSGVIGLELLTMASL
ncbi:hypothetical protein FRC09_002864 [Ceratobasidium sp. 395]|nr:hypothetical protein FRC09_002864 [Ceratobasidium sp. 395]